MPLDVRGPLTLNKQGSQLIKKQSDAAQVFEKIIVVIGNQ